MDQQLAVRDTLAVAVDEAPAQVVRSQIDSALAAEVAATQAPWQPSGGARPSDAGPAPVLLLALVLLLLLAVRFVGRRWPDALGARAPSDALQPSPDLDPEPVRKASAVVKPAPERMVLPPHVVAMLQRSEARRIAAEQAARDGGPDDEEPDAQDPATGANRGVDVWIGR